MSSLILLPIFCFVLVISYLLYFTYHILKICNKSLLLSGNKIRSLISQQGLGLQVWGSYTETLRQHLRFKFQSFCSVFMVPFVSVQLYLASTYFLCKMEEREIRKESWGEEKDKKGNTEKKTQLLLLVISLSFEVQRCLQSICYVQAEELRVGKEGQLFCHLFTINFEFSGNMFSFFHSIGGHYNVCIMLLPLNCGFHFVARFKFYFECHCIFSLHLFIDGKSDMVQGRPRVGGLATAGP